MKTADGRTPGQVAFDAWHRAFYPNSDADHPDYADQSDVIHHAEETAAQAVLDAFRDQIERKGAVKALRLLTEQCPGDWAGIGLCAMRQSARQIKEKIESGEVKL